MSSVSPASASRRMTGAPSGSCCRRRAKIRTEPPLGSPSSPPDSRPSPSPSSAASDSGAASISAVERPPSPSASRARKVRSAAPSRARKAGGMRCRRSSSSRSAGRAPPGGGSGAAQPVSPNVSDTANAVPSLGVRDCMVYLPGPANSWRRPVLKTRYGGTSNAVPHPGVRDCMVCLTLWAAISPALVRRRRSLPRRHLPGWNPVVPVVASLDRKIVGASWLRPDGSWSRGARGVAAPPAPRWSLRRTDGVGKPGPFVRRRW